jgi:large subunit ribosomal protein L29
VTSADDLRNMPDRALAEHIASARKDIFGLRFQHATGELENTAGLRASKRELARALTIAQERRLTQAARAEDEHRG